MKIFSPLTVKRFQAFRRIRRAWWSLLALGVIFVFTLFAEWVCPCDPRAVVPVKELEPYREVEVEHIYDIKAARFNLMADGTIDDYEGPTEVRNLISQGGDALATIKNSARQGGDALATIKNPALQGGDALATIKNSARQGGDALATYTIITKARDGYTRVFLEPLAPPAVVERRLPPKDVAFPFRPVPGHPFGLDAGGRDVYARVVHGMRIALLFGLALALSGMFFGAVMGAIEGYFGGVVDLAGQRFTEIWSALPFLYVMIFIGSTVGRSFAVLLVCYALFNWITVSYYMRAEFLRLRKRPFVEAAKLHGFSTARILFVHILPNSLTPLITLFPFLLMGAIGSLAALDFLGFGLPPMTPSCGELLAEAQQFRGAWWLIVFPSAALFIVMLLAVLVGEGLRDAFDPRENTRLE